ncbi:L,D-transpeptidase [Peribacillus cavernae]|uniref:L,D-transpeptidase n=1 Tax=Peribacillus cavernae TaxID=1674310 RepID=A0A3S0TWT6_9BACI|nr:L,D-transpeptidase [Peribacillus cavernae]MDQ0220766.1 lipoprotein-anchoring transpeptidase ErfK/SrfK [Peribacillus cavernae]RUQ24805.1 L,D-transpeptidase [Peribacillus cavernae]
MKLLLSILLALTVSPVYPDAPAVKPGDPFLIVNKATNKLAFIDDNAVQEVLPAGTGKSDELTPEGLFTVKVKAVNPYYRKKNIPGGDPKNPLGTRWIGFDAKNTDGRIYGVHGTNQPWTVGKNISAGCIRLKNADVERLYNKVPIGTKILVTRSTKDFYTLAKQNGAIK